MTHLIINGKEKKIRGGGGGVTNCLQSHLSQVGKLQVVWLGFGKKQTKKNPTTWQLCMVPLQRL